MKKTKRKKQCTIALLYHYLPKTVVKQYFSKEHALVDQDTDNTVKYMKSLFTKRGYKVQVIQVTDEDLSPLKKLRADFIFNLVDSKSMEVKMAKWLDRLKIPYSGSSFEAIKTSNNKLRSKKLFEKNALPTPKYTIIRLTDRISRALLPGKFPIIIKPAFEHCSIGITDKSVVQNYQQFKAIVASQRKKFHQALLAEEFIPGKELQVTVLEKKNNTIALPIAEIAFKHRLKTKWNIYGFDEKWGKHLPVYESRYFVAPPRRLDTAVDTKIRKDAIRAFYALGLKDYARFDLRYNPTVKQWYFLEANANSAIDPDPCDAMTTSVKAQGMTLDDFVLQIVKNSIN